MKSPAEIAQKYVQIGKAKAEAKASQTFLLAIMAGAFIALGGLGSQIASCLADNASSARVISSVVFPIGLFMVLVGGAELFTGNCLITIPVLKKETTPVKMLKNWGIVYFGNMVGGFIIAAIAAFGHIYSFGDGQLATNVVATAVTKSGISFSDHSSL